MKILKPTGFDRDHYFSHYINVAPELDVISSLERTKNDLTDYIGELSQQQGAYAYAVGKWTIKQVLQHINDTERILAYRALRFSRKDKTNLPGFDQNTFAENDYSNSVSIEEVKNEFIAVRQSTQLLFSKMNEDVIDFEGMASDFGISARAMGWVISGHLAHHLNVLKERYQNA